MKSCPSSTELGQWLADGLAGAEADAVDVHVENCVACQQTLERLTDDVAVRNDRGPATRGESGGDFLRRLERGPPTETWLGSRPSERDIEAQDLVPPAPAVGFTVDVVAARGIQTAGASR